MQPAHMRGSINHPVDTCRYQSLHFCFLGSLVFGITNCKHKQVYSKITHFKMSSKSIWTKPILFKANSLIHVILLWDLIIRRTWFISTGYQTCCTSNFNIIPIIKCISATVNQIKPSYSRVDVWHIPRLSKSLLYPTEGSLVPASRGLPPLSSSLSVIVRAMAALSWGSIATAEFTSSSESVSALSPTGCSWSLLLDDLTVKNNVD
mgnify:CR=1 FL=1